MTNPVSAVAGPRRSRNALLIVLMLFFGGMLAAGTLRFSGWRPHGMKNKGELLQPYGDLRGYSPTLVGGAIYRWNDSPRTWRIVTLPRDCDGARRNKCLQLLQNMDKVWRLMGREADRVHVLWGGAAPVDVAALREVRLLQVNAGLRAGLPRWNEETARGDLVWLVDPNGFAVLRYAPGFDPGDLRSDLSHLLKVN